jgi:hypothetical protein
MPSNEHPHEKTAKVVVYKDGVDKSYLGDNQRWWFDPSFPHSFSIFDLDTFYEDTYFAKDHVGPKTVKAYVDHVLEFGHRLLGRPVKSILEAGCGGGWFTVEFLRRGLDVLALEGTHSGYAKTVGRGVEKSRVMRHDLRLPFSLGRRFDIALCTEVAEHIECPFSSQLISGLVNHSELIWFSFEEPGSNSASYHHCNEQPEQFWINLFRFYGYRMYRLPPEVIAAVEMRGRMIFCGPGIDAGGIEKMDCEAKVGLGMTDPLAPQTVPAWKKFARSLVPPAMWNCGRILAGRGR